MSFTRFGSLPLEIRQYIWHQALQEEVDSRLIFVHRRTMRVMPHTTTVSHVMNANREARHYATKYIYDVQLDVWTLSVDFNAAAEIAEFEQSSKSSYFTEGHPAMDVAIGRHGASMRAKFMFGLLDTHLRPKLCQQVTNQARATLPKRDDPNNPTRRRGTIHLSSQYDRFALTGDSGTNQAPWGVFVVDMCERAFLRDYLCRDLDRFARERARLDPEYLYRAGGDPQDEFLSRHMAARLPASVLQRIRRLVYVNHHSYFRTNIFDPHVCGREVGQDTRAWRLGTFKGVSDFYTASMRTVPTSVVSTCITAHTEDEVVEDEDKG
ncbi:hypothetical protein PG990_004005 [Apiospora arundinis]